MASVVTLPPSFQNVSETSLWVSVVPGGSQNSGGMQNSVRVSEPQGQERSAGDLVGSGTEDHWNDMAAYCQGVPITGCVPLPDYLGTLELELTKVDIW